MWSVLSSTISEEAIQLFLVTTKYSVGKGDQVRFWHNMWIEVWILSDIAPNLYPIKARGGKKRTAVEALVGNQLINDIRKHFR